ncbi:hypothetical protein ABBQ38_007985 [Trebouxia sp. C0009 RCD-2024]
MQPLQTCHSEQCRLAALSAHSRRLTSLPAVQHAHHRGTHPRAPTVQRKRKSMLVRAEDSSADKLELGLAPAKPRSPVGQMVTYYLKMEPHLFKDALDEQFRRLKDEKDEAEQRRKAQKEQLDKQKNDKTKKDGGELVLFQRMEDLKSSEQRATVEDLMYASVLEKFLELKVEMMPRMDDSIVENQTHLKTLTEGIHSKEALQLVREHVLGVMGPASMAYSSSMIKMAKLQAAQVYAASIMFGYFIRRVDKRFQLETQLGLLDDEQADAVARLERLFNSASEDQQDADRPASSSGATSSSTFGDGEATSSSSGAGTQAEGAGLGKGKKKDSKLRKYIESFDQQTLAEMTKQVSQEGAALIDVQTTALFGNLRDLQVQMQKAVGQDATSVEELMQKVQDAVAKDEVESLNITVGTQRRAVLEAVAFGTFLRDVESYVDGEYQLLTPLSSASRGGGGGGGISQRPPLTGV